MMSVLSYVAAVFGIIFGVLLTLQLNRLLRGTTLPQYTQQEQLPGQYGNYSFLNVLKSYPKLNLEVNNMGKIDDLERERKALNARLHEIQAELQKLANDVDTFKPESKKFSICPYDFKVYVYDIPQQLESIRLSEEARHNKSLHVCHKCILEQFSLEYIINDYFVNFCGRTYNPEEADFFYLPLVRDAEFRFVMSISTRNRAPSRTEWALLNILEKNDSSLWRSMFNITDKYWHAHNGANHIIAMPAPVTNIRHETSRRGFFHYMMHLHPPIFLCLEYSIGFVQEYPVCATQKNIVVPYPTTDHELFNGKLTAQAVDRKYLIYYAGGMHGDCVEVRRAMKFLMQNSTRLVGVIPPVRSNQAEREHGFRVAKFCPIPIGDSPSSKRMYDVLNFGCIPVVLSDDLVWAFSDQTGGPLKHNSFSLQIPQNVVHFTATKTLNRYRENKKAMGSLPVSKKLVYDILEEAHTRTGDYHNGIFINPLVLILQNIPEGDVSYLQQGVADAAPHYRYYNMRPDMTQIPLATHIYPDGGAMELIAQELSRRKQRGLDKLSAQCAAERGQKHKYIGNFACDGRDRVDSLVRQR